MMAHFVFSFMDMNKYLLRNEAIGVAQRVALVPLGGTREVYGLSLNPPGKLDG